MTPEQSIGKLLEAGATPEEAGVAAKRLFGLMQGFAGPSGFNAQEMLENATGALVASRNFTRAGADKAFSDAVAAGQAFINAEQ
jgi:hypothetical protein